MENVRIIEMDDNISIMALFNPDGIRPCGITASRLDLFCKLGIAQNVLTQLAAGFIRPYFIENVDTEYKGYVPIAMIAKALPNDMILPVMKLVPDPETAKEFTESDDGSGVKDLMSSKSEKYISEYIDEYLNQQDDSYDQNSQNNFTTEETDSKNWYTFMFPTLGAALDACFAVPVKTSKASDIIRHKDKYYISFLLDDVEEKSIETSCILMAEFNGAKSGISHTYLHEHGTLITDQIAKIRESGLAR